MPPPQETEEYRIVLYKSVRVGMLVADARPQRNERLTSSLDVINLGRLQKKEGHETFKM